ncbi:MAG: hypothetical protein JWM36_2714 [Hyphomicrobiales bacterium]|nr:hypothetical protein [Hyphomicrobiales bacterium]
MPVTSTVELTGMRFRGDRDRAFAGSPRVAAGQGSQGAPMVGNQHRRFFDVGLSP